MSESTVNIEKLIGVEVSNSALKAVCINRNGVLTDVYQVATDKNQETFAQLVNFINQLKSKFGGFDKIGIAVPGLVHAQTKRVAFSTFIPEHEQIDFLTELETATGLKITIENDANAAAYGEFLQGAGRDSKSMFYATLGTGIGGALILNGKIWRGASGFAGEFGHIAINSDGVKLEDVASTANIVRRTRSRFHQDQTSSLSKLTEEEIRLSNVVRAAQKEDDFAQMMLERTGTYIGTALAGVINLLNIEKIVVGGEILQAGHLVLDAIIQRARELAFAPSFEATEIVEGELGENAAAVGVALLLVEP
ncbi:MAG: ROK family protein [Acidobacteria bacterium]|nr:ROK family protein [Acidobacteriota bacterium]